MTDRECCGRQRGRGEVVAEEGEAGARIGVDSS